MNFIKFQVKRFRSIVDLKLNLSEETPTIICGENNVGKTNFLRSLDLFFNHIHSTNLFNPESDIPHHKFYGSRGAGANTELFGTFSDDKDKIIWKVKFKSDGTIEYKKNNISSDQKKFTEFIDQFRFLFVESNNINIPYLISQIMDEEGLLPLDNKRAKQSRALKTLEKFILESQAALKDIEKKLNECFEGLTSFDGNLKGKEIKIKIAEFNKLREPLRNMTEITLYDGNDHEVASKGSGAQRAVLLALMQYITMNIKKRVIWGIDEPEAFLHPKLQKQVAKSFEHMLSHSKQLLILTTHSQHFINLQDIDNVHLFQSKKEEKTYSRRPGEKFTEIDTYIKEFVSNSDKALSIKDELGIQINDGWTVLPQNVIVEGEDDKKYLMVMHEALGMKSPNFICCNGADNLKALLQFYNDQAQELAFSPEFKCILDNDSKGRQVRDSVANKTYERIKVSIIELPIYDGTSNKTKVDWEIEDFIPPDLIKEAINSLLQKAGYNLISDSKFESRYQEAYKDQQILKFMENLIKSENPDMKPFELETLRRKYLICEHVCLSITNNNNILKLSDEQQEFLKKLTET